MRFRAAYVVVVIVGLALAMLALTYRSAPTVLREEASGGAAAVRPTATGVISREEILRRVASLRGDAPLSQDAAARRAELRREAATAWTAARDQGERAPGAKSPEFYAELRTTQLLEECLAGTLFQNYTCIYNDPMIGILRLQATHPGFTELFRRTDLVDGLVETWRRLAVKIAESADVYNVVAAAGVMRSLLMLYDTPEFAKQIAGRELELVRAHTEALRGLAACLDQLEQSTLQIYGEARRVALANIALLATADPARAEEGVRRIAGFGFPFTQKIEDVRTFVKMVMLMFE